MPSMIDLKSPLTSRYAIIGLAVALVGAGAYVWLHWGGQKSDPLYAYYPEQTTFFVEAEPGEKVSKKLLHWMDMGVQQASDAERSPKPGQVIQSKSSELQSNSESDAFRRAFVDKFETTFKPHVSFGLWAENVSAELSNPSDSKDSQLKRLSSANALMILPLKKELDFPTLVRQFNGDIHSFTVRKEKDLTYYVLKSDESDPAGLENTFAIVNKHVFVTNHANVMTDVLSHLNDKKSARIGKNIFDHPTNKRYLALLDNHREGTLILNNTAYAEQMKRLSKVVPSAIPTAIQDRVLMYADVTPLTMAALHVKNGNQLETDFYMPLNLKALHNEKLSKEIRSLYQAKKALDAGQYLPESTTFLLDVHGIDQWYDLYQHHLMPPEQQNQVQQFSALLSMPMLGLNWRKDLIGMFGGETIFASIQGNPVPVILLEGTSDKLNSFQRLLNIITSGKFFPVQHNEVQIGNVAVQSFTIPKQSERLNVGALEYQSKRKMIAVAQANDFEKIANISTKRLSNLEDNASYRDLVRAFPKNMALFLYSDVDANQKEFQKTLREARVSSKSSKATIELTKQLKQEAQQTVTHDISKLAAAVWAEPKGDAEDLVQAKVVVQLKP